MDRQTRVLLLDHHPAVRRGLRALLDTEADFLVVGEAETLPAALEEAPALAPDVIVMEWPASHRGGAAPVARLHSALPDAHILILTNNTKSGLMKAALAAGAEGYLLKGPALCEIVQAIRRVGRGEGVFHPAVSRALLQSEGRDGGSE